jgi:hypothetical protein
MKISALEKMIAQAKEKGYTYISINDFGIKDNNSTRISTHPICHIKNKFFVTVYNYPSMEGKKLKTAIEGEHFAIIECKIIGSECSEITGTMESGVSVLVDLEPLTPLPDWYNEEDRYDDFDEVELSTLKTDDDWFGTNELRGIMELEIFDTLDIEFKSEK